ncbi:phenylalanine--tRNA ligase subunit beta [Metamycoplasma neophronis]|uniref:phenylalanine--tRNA ligase n=1 Tax=Metamycoplasma neophronis TaxID=872983 RepID=A0ABY2Z0E6_9BACT|nr:phenylalanine--tRNA ligase subunit beta [Metamycoplasma neophronis]TPR54350.1 phenylalanine--tRNA ligase subunit beta [Metamycoplasma neophronis]
MIFSYKQLCRLANLKNISVEEVVNAINSIGFEVEEYHKFADVEGIKFCHVLKAYKNPNADRLTVCEVEFGDGSKSIIQTNATNMHDDDYVMAFVPGSRTGKLVLQSRMMQGIISEGMFVGLHEIGIDENVAAEDSFDGIFQVGKVDLNLDPMEYFDLDDYMIDVSILSNRADALCYLVFAKELAAYFDTEVVPLPKANANLVSDLKIGTLKDTNAFSLVEANNTDLKLSIQEEFLLWKHGIKTFRNAVDITNLVLIYAGVPCHVYNKAQLKSNEFSVGFSSDKVNIFGDKEVTLDKNLVVKNGDEPVSLAATIGLENYQYTNSAQKAVFELASFNLKEVRKNAKQIKFDTNSSSRANKEISNGEILMAYEFLAQYLKEYSVLINAPKVHKKTILLDTRYITKYAGFNITKTKKYAAVLNKLISLGFKFKSDYSAVTFPLYRYDLKNMQDFVEEVFRFYGYDNFPSKQPKITRLILQTNIEDKFNNIFKNKGYMNVRTYTLIKPETNIFNPFGFEETLNAVASKNYDHSQIRYSMIMPLANVLIHNEKQGMPKGSYFEIGMINKEMNVLGICSNEKTFNEIKKDIISLTNQKLVFKPSNKSCFNPNASTDIYLGENYVGYIAKLHPSLLNINAIFAEIKLDEIKDKRVEFKDYKHAPLKTRDITVGMKPHDSLDAIVEKINKVVGVHSVSVKDTYVKDENLINVTLSVTLEEWATKKFDSIFA